MSAPHIEDRVVALGRFGEPSRPGRARVRLWPPPARALRAAKALLACWGLAAVGLFIPVAHFFLVPGFLIAGVVLAVRRSREAATFAGVQGTCPGCGREGEFKARGKFALPKETSCSGCNGRVTIEEAAAEPEVAARGEAGGAA